LIQLDATDETMMSTIQYKVEAILDLSLQELAMLKMVVEDHRELNPIKESKMKTKAINYCPFILKARHGICVR